MTHATVTTEKPDEALTHLNEAAKDRRGDLQKPFAAKYTDLKSAVGGAAHASAKRVKEQVREVGEVSQLAAKTVNHSVRRHPWYYVGGAAVGGLLVGLMLGHRRQTDHVKKSVPGTTSALSGRG
ncbi:MAG: hypothetical protein R6X13_04985 [bacterium]